VNCTDKGSILINAPVSVVYAAFQSSEAMECWLPPDGMTGKMLAFDFREGGYYRMRLSYDGMAHPQGKTTHDADEVEVEIVRLVENQCIEQRVIFESDKQEFSGTMKIIWRFQKTDNGTKVSVQFDDVPVGISKEVHEAGISASLNNLSQYVEGNDPA